MANNQYINKVVYGNSTLIDLTADTATEEKVLSGYTFHKADGSTVSGTCDFDVDSSDCDATIAEVLVGKTFAKGGSVLTGEMPNVGAQTGTISAKAQSVAISRGYHDGSGSVAIASTEQAKIIAGNIKSGVSILGVAGTYTGAEQIKGVVANVTPSTAAQTILPTDLGDYNSITQVNVAAIPYTETDNAAGGRTVTIGGTA